MKADILIQISPKFILKGSINNMPALVQIMAWCRWGNKSLCEPMLVQFTTEWCIYASLDLGARTSPVTVMTKSESIISTRPGMAYETSKNLHRCVEQTPGELGQKTGFNTKSLHAFTNVWSWSGDNAGTKFTPQWMGPTLNFTHPLQNHIPQTTSPTWQIRPRHFASQLCLCEHRCCSPVRRSKSVRLHSPHVNTALQTASLFTLLNHSSSFNINMSSYQYWRFCIVDIKWWEEHLISTMVSNDNKQFILICLPHAVCKYHGSPGLEAKMVHRILWIAVSCSISRINRSYITMAQ